MSTAFNLVRDINGNNSFIPSFSTDGSGMTLTANVAQTVTVPSNFPTWVAVFGYTPGANVWIANNTTATVPGGAAATTQSTLNPVGKYVKAGDVLSFISSDTSSPQVKVEFYYLQSSGVI